LVLADGAFLIADSENDRIRRVESDGRIVTVAGTREGFAGDGGPANRARMDEPFSLASDSTGGYFIAEGRDYHVRHVGANGTIRSVAGRAFGDYSGDGGPAIRAGLSVPTGVATTLDGGLLIADTDNGVVRYVTGSSPRLLAAAVRGPFTFVRGHATRVRLVVSMPARGRVDVLARGRIVRRIVIRASAGSREIRLPSSLQVGRYDLRAVLRAADGQMATARQDFRIRAS
jgi:hypothetical protein